MILEACVTVWSILKLLFLLSGRGRPPKAAKKAESAEDSAEDS